MHVRRGFPESCTNLAGQMPNIVTLQSEPIMNRMNQLRMALTCKSEDCKLRESYENSRFLFQAEASGEYPSRSRQRKISLTNIDPQMQPSKFISISTSVYFRRNRSKEASGD